MDNRRIGVFDSGLGGLTAVREIMEKLPQEDIVYFGDTGRVPYGTRDTDTILKYAKQDIRFLMHFDVKLIVIACGTVSAVALPRLENSKEPPLIGVVEATAKAAAAATKNKKIGVIGTPGTIRSGAYEKVIHKEDPSIQTYAAACPLFVPLAENGHITTQVVRLVAEEYLANMRETGIDTLILGCTHYPLLKEVIADTMGGQVQLIEPGVEITRYLKKTLPALGLQAQRQEEGTCRYYVSDAAADFEKLASLFLNKRLEGQAQKIDIETY